MPESWPGGQTFYKEILDGEVDQQINALWAYLEGGSNAQTEGSGKIKTGVDRR